MKILLLGANGQVGWALKQRLSKLGELKSCTRSDLDLNEFEDIRSVVSAFKPNVIVNAAAYTAVDKAESEPVQARRINADAVGVLAQEAKHIDAWLLHYSTDYVFDGTKAGAYSETDLPNPLSVYGKTKLEGEELIRRSGCKHIIFRTSWVVGSHGKNFVKTILRLAQEKESIKVVNDQSGAPTSAALIAEVTREVIENLSSEMWPVGIYHLAPHGEVSWHGLASFIVASVDELGVRLKLNQRHINAICTDEYPAEAKRPSNSRLETSKLESLLSFNLPHWKIGMTDMLRDITREQLVS
ncbi:MAG: dTDP-4-dehydrorhamnose reductase [Candidatus Sedimenticola sp. 20ELBAFRAG]